MSVAATSVAGSAGPAGQRDHRVQVAEPGIAGEEDPHVLRARLGATRGQNLLHGLVADIGQLRQRQAEKADGEHDRSRGTPILDALGSDLKRHLPFETEVIALGRCRPQGWPRATR